uniref:Protein phosphatase 1 regulatory subunit 12A n=1 Tax=Rousettus aegyptiacus TaxID=9407 RepID=A0A7J8JM99_ROUAE|nr:protein phosphatase 1 regulatory subunit 12A [Rousettus aegyptiacus]
MKKKKKRKKKSRIKRSRKKRKSQKHLEKMNINRNTPEHMMRLISVTDQYQLQVQPLHPLHFLP